MFIRITQHYCIMQKFNGGNPVRICDECRTMFYPGDTIVELCKECASTVWCVFSTYEDGSVELSSIHHNQVFGTVYGWSQYLQPTLTAS